MKFTPRKIIAEEELIAPEFDSNRTYDGSEIVHTILNSFTLNNKYLPMILEVGKDMDIFEYSKPELILSDICNKFFEDDEMDANELSAQLLKFAEKMKFNQQELDELANEIKHTTNPKGNRQNEFRNTIEEDIKILEDIRGEVNSFAADVRLENLIQELRKLEYNGSADLAYRKDMYDPKKHKRTVE